MHVGVQCVVCSTSFHCVFANINGLNVNDKEKKEHFEPRITLDYNHIHPRQDYTAGKTGFAVFSGWEHML